MRAVVIAAVLMGIAAPSWAGERALAFPVSGVVDKIDVTAGGTVNAGDVLAVLDLTPFQAKKRAADARVKATKTLLDIAEMRYTQTRELFDALSTSAENVDVAETTRANARVAYEEALRDAKLAAWELDRATLKAPFGGTVASVPGFAGQVVNMNAETAPVVVITAP